MKQREIILMVNGQKNKQLNGLQKYNLASKERAEQNIEIF